MRCCSSASRRANACAAEDKLRIELSSSEDGEAMVRVLQAPRVSKYSKYTVK